MRIRCNLQEGTGRQIEYLDWNLNLILKKSHRGSYVKYNIKHLQVVYSLPGVLQPDHI